MEYAAEGSNAPLVAIRDGRYKFVHCEIDPPQLFDLEADPHELSNLADRSGACATGGGFHGKGPRALGHGGFRRRRARASQARRWVVYPALRNGAYYPWEFQPLQKASERYMRNHMDLNVLEEQQAVSARRIRWQTFSFPPLTISSRPTPSPPRRRR